MKYYFIDTKYFGKRDIYIIPDENTWTPNICPECGGNHVTTSVPASIAIKGVPCDFYDNSGQLFISSKCLHVFNQLELTGYTVLPAKIRLRNVLFNSNLEYYELIIQGRCGYVRDLKHEILPKCDSCGRRLPLKESIAGCCFEESEYDGSDIFSFNNLVNFPIVNETVKKQLLKSNLSNLKFTELSKMTIL